MKYLFKVFLVSVMLCLGACTSSSASDEPPAYIDESEITSALNKPDSYKGKAIKLSGMVFNVETDGNQKMYQCWYDVRNNNAQFIVYTESEETFNDDDFITVDGVITGTFKGENYFGGTITAPQIKATSITRTSYVAGIDPAVTTKDVNKSQTQHDVTLTVTKVEFSKTETRVYVTVKNDSKTYDCSVYGNMAKLIQNGKQYEYSFPMYDDKVYGDLGDVSAGASVDAILRFEAQLDPDQEMTLKIEAYSDNYNIDMKDFKITMS